MFKTRKLPIVFIGDTLVGGLQELKASFNQ
jgi:hypothetical protein